MMMRPRNSRERGFTILELMVVVAIIGILSLISTIQFSKYRQRSQSSAVKSDLRNAATAQEAYFADQNTYCNASADLTVSSYGLAITEGVNLRVASATTTGYIMTAFHSSGATTFTLAGPGGSITP